MYNISQSWGSRNTIRVLLDGFALVLNYLLSHIVSRMKHCRLKDAI